MDAKAPAVPADLIDRFTAIVGAPYALRDEAAIAVAARDVAQAVG